jgi:Cysteine-rich secretory protein family
MIAASLQGTLGEAVMRTVLLGAVVAITSTLAHAEDMAEMISRYRHAHGLSAVKTDPQLTAIAERQAKAMAASGIMDHSVAGSFTARISGVRTGMAAENIAVGTKTWVQTFHMWQTSPGHNANLLLSKADIVGVAVAHNDQTRYKTYWAMVIAEKPSRKSPSPRENGKPRNARRVPVAPKIRLVRSRILSASICVERHLYPQ